MAEKTTKRVRTRKADEPDEVEKLRGHLAKKPADVDVWLKLARLLETRGEHTPAAAAFEGLAAAQESAGFRPRAIASLSQALRLAPGSMSAGSRLAELLIEERKPADAASALRALASGLPANARRDAIKVWTQVAQLQPRSDATVRLAQFLAADGQRELAADKLHVHATTLLEAGNDTDALATLERALVLYPGHPPSADGAARLALRRGEARRALGSARAGLEIVPEHPDLLTLAAAALEMLGEKAKGALLYRLAAARLTALDRADDAEVAWRGVLRYDPEDPRGREAVAPLLDAEEDTSDGLHGHGHGHGHAPARDAFIPELEIDVELAVHMPAARIVPDIQTSVVDAGWDDEPASAPKLTLVPDERSILPKPIDLPPAPVDAPSPVVAATPTPTPTPPPVVSAPLPLPPIDAAGAIRPRVHRALVIASGPEGGWWVRALEDHGLECVVASAQELEAAVARATDARCDAVIVPAELAEAWKVAGDWLVVATVVPEREELDRRLRAAGLATIDRRPVPTADALKQVIEAWGTPFELVGASGEPLKVTGAAAPAYVHAVAKQKLGGALFAQPITDATIQVAVAAGVGRATALGAWTVEGAAPAITISVDEAGETNALPLAAEYAVAAGLTGLATVTLARARDRLVVASIGPLDGAGALCAEARTGLALPIIALELARGAPPPHTPPRRGHARAVRLDMPPGQVGGVRVETPLSSADAGVLVCASGATAAACERALRRALGG